MTMRDTIKLVDELTQRKTNELRTAQRKDEEAFRKSSFETLLVKYKPAYDKYTSAKKEFYDRLKKDGNLDDYHGRGYGEENDPLRNYLSDRKFTKDLEKIGKEYEKKIETISNIADRTRASVVLKTAKNETMLQEFLTALEKM